MSWQNGTQGADIGMYSAKAANGAVGAVGEYDGQGALPDSAGSPQPPNVYHPQVEPGPAPTYDAYADPAAAHGWQNAYDATAELPAMRAIGAEGQAAGVAAGVSAGGHRRKKSASSRRGVVVGVVAGAVGVVSVMALIVGVSGSDAPSGGGSGGEGKRSRPTAGASVTPVREPAVINSSAPVGAGARDVASASPGAAQNSPGGSTYPTPSRAAPTASASPSGATSPTATVNGDSGPGNSGNKSGRGKGAIKGPK
ncbi:hypothetical protein PV396_34050 [Streptomyces sp. ME02-8801-2C]|uniref:hypothetical protein n=1 Tax=Streptomyces sp. ME02-8801-2C TaxID=3028680 RepID=UPI0029AA9C71|nr:hypothetical protein [Streptomyces sp. ME02-8801-2C]MDX3456916.1 hypothetical protein [Streptomyces sp. ME02-8801-2C]